MSEVIEWWQNWIDTQPDAELSQVRKQQLHNEFANNRLFGNQFDSEEWVSTITAEGNIVGKYVRLLNPQFVEAMLFDMGILNLPVAVPDPAEAQPASSTVTFNYNQAVRV